MIAIYCKEIKIKICYSKKEKVDLYILPIKKKDGLFSLQRYNHLDYSLKHERITINFISQTETKNNVLISDKNFHFLMEKIG